MHANPVNLTTRAHSGSGQNNEVRVRDLQKFIGHPQVEECKGVPQPPHASNVAFPGGW